MRLLLDTHTIIWALSGDPRLSEKAQFAIIEADEVYWSIVSLWELAIKHSLPKRSNLRLAPDWEKGIPKRLEQNQIKQIDIATIHCAQIAKLPHIHGDPFDRMLIAKAQCDDLILLSRDNVFTKYDVKLIW